MGEHLTLPVPETLFGTYAVALAEPLTDPTSLARDHVERHTPPPLRDLVLGMLGSPMMTLDQRPTADFPPLPADLLAAYGAAAPDLEAIASAAHVIAVRAAYRPGRPPAHELASRAVAGALGTIARAPVVDVFTPQVLAPSHLRRSLGTFRLTDWMLLPHTSGPGGFFVTTKGLARFGLPELQTEDVPAGLVEPWGRILNGLAHRLLDLWLDELPVDALTADIPGTVTVGLRDIAAAQGAEDPSGREVPVRLRPAPGPVLTAGDDPQALCTALFGTPPCR
ncbi:hypothetical protein [Actinomadura bangladeshensis]|uniref:hypothetical protein n=1 Tax=Actinomadura bangladeshensis TaxID=453573 RepID=UPI001EF2AC2E|nr:hypothetical protein [Actinomadura bangladeshensis]